MASLLETLRSGRVLLMDGAMGTELQRAGIGEGECYELWNLTHPEKVRAIHQAYVDAGADVLLTHTFQASPDNLAKFGLGDRLEMIWESALENCRSIAGTNRFVLADIGPIDKLGPATVARILNAVRGADAILLETWSDL